MKFIDRIRSRKLKGAVLFTVVSVCAVIIIFVMATLTIVATVQRRTYSDYAKSQSYYTARSAVNSVLTALNQSDSAAKDLALTFKNTTGRTELTINMGDNSDLGTITSCYVDRISDELYKICATARVLDDESTVAVYVYEGTKIEPSSGNSNSSAITTFGLSNSNNLSFLGGGAVNVYDDECPSPDHIENSNNNDIVGGCVINASYTMKAQSKYVIERNQGVSIFGDFINVNTTEIIPTFNLAENGATSYSGGKYKLMLPDASEEIKLSDIPYVFCTGKFSWFEGAGNLKVGLYDQSAKVYCPINIFCGSFILKDKDNSLTGSIYCHDATATSTISPNNSFSLYGWVESLAQNGSSSDILVYNGDFYTKGNLNIGGNNKNYYFNGDLCVDGTLTISRETNLYLRGGELKAGKLVLASGASFKLYYYNEATGAYDPVDTNTIYQTSTDSNRADELALYYSACTAAGGDWTKLHDELAKSPATKTTLPGNITYQDILDSMTFFSSDVELRNILSGYYYAVDAFGNVDDSIIYHDAYPAVGEPSTYEYQQPESGFINTVAAVKQHFPEDETRSSEDNTVYECEAYSSPAEFDVVLKSGDYLELTDGTSSDQPFTVKVLSASGVDRTQEIINAGLLDSYYTVDSANKVFTVKCNALFKGTLSKAKDNNYQVFIDPQAANADLYVKFEDCYSENIKWVVNDVAEAGKDTRMCYMYFSKSTTVAKSPPNYDGIYTTNSINFSNSYIASKYYHDYFTGATPSLFLEQNPPSDSRQIPNIYIYVQPYTNIWCQNNCAFTAYINAPRGSIHTDNGVTKGDIYYTTGEFTSESPVEASKYYQKLENKGIAMLGSFVFGGTQMTNSTVTYMYISDEGRHDDDNDDDGNEVFTWQPLYYDSN